MLRKYFHKNGFREFVLAKTSSHASVQRGCDHNPYNVQDCAGLKITGIPPADMLFSVLYSGPSMVALLRVFCSCVYNLKEYCPCF